MGQMLSWLDAPNTSDDTLSNNNHSGGSDSPASPALARLWDMSDQATHISNDRQGAAPRKGLLRLPPELLEEIGSFLSQDDLHSFILLSYHVYKSCVQLRYRGWNNLNPKVLDLERLRFLSRSDLFLSHAHAFKVDVNPQPGSVKVKMAGKPVTATAFRAAYQEYNTLVLRILQSAQQVTAVQLYSSVDPIAGGDSVSPDLKTTLQSLVDTDFVNYSGQWGTELLRDTIAITTCFRHVKKIEIHELYCPRSDQIYLELFQHFLYDFTHLTSLRASFHLLSFDIFSPLQKVAHTAPVRQFKALAIVPSSYSMLLSQVSSLPSEADMVFSFLSPEVTNPIIGLNASTFAHLVHQGKLLEVRQLRLAFPLERIGDLWSTDHYLSTLPASFLYGSKLTRLELETLMPDNLLSRLSNVRDEAEAGKTLPFPMLQTVRITCPPWYLITALDKSRAKAVAPALARALAKRGVTLVWEDAEYD